MARSVPAGSVAVPSVATPLPFSVPTPREVEPLKKVTLPAGTPADDATVAVNVTLEPEAALPGAFSVVVVGAGVTWKLCVAVAAEYSELPACVACSTTVPMPVRVTVPPAISLGQTSP